MIPSNGQHVKVYFYNGIVEEGIVVEWSDNKSIIKALSSDNLLIIQNTAQNIVAIKVFACPSKAEDGPSVPDDVFVDKELVLEEPERDISLRAVKLANLRLLRGNEERERARRLLTTFKPTGNFSYKEVYGPPTRLQEPPNFDSAKKNRPGNSNSNR